MLFARIGVYLMAGDARGEFRPVHSHIPDIAQHKPVDSVQTEVVRLREIDLIVLEKIVTRNEVIRVRKPRRPGPSQAQVALGACRLNCLGIFLALLREKDQRCIIGMLEVDIAMTGVTVESKGRECQGLGVDSRCVTAGTAVCESICIPRWTGQPYPLRRSFISSKHCLGREDGELAV